MVEEDEEEDELRMSGREGGGRSKPEEESGRMDSSMAKRGQEAELEKS